MRRTQLILPLFALILFSCSTRYYQGPVTDHFDGKRFFNPGKPMHKSFFQLLQWRWTRKPDPWPAYSELPFTDKPPERVTGNQLRVSFVGHVTTLIQTQGMNILTDPIWSDRASPVSWLGPKRVHPPGVRFEDLPPIDLVLISHNHYDHLDLPTIKRLWQRDRPTIITPLGNDTIIRKAIAGARVQTADWSDRISLTPAVAVHLEPMHHWSARNLFDHNRALWAAFVLTTPGGNIYFAGDSGFGGGDYFREAKAKYTSFRLALLPIGSYDPRWFMAYGHMNPAEALQAWNLLGQPAMLPTHYRAFPLADTGYATPLADLEKAISTMAAPPQRIRPLMAGEHWWVAEE